MKAASISAGYPYRPTLDRRDRESSRPGAGALKTHLEGSHGRDFESHHPPDARREDVIPVIVGICWRMIALGGAARTDRGSAAVGLLHGVRRLSSAIRTSSSWSPRTSEGKVVGCLQLCILPGLSSQGASRGLIEDVRVASHLRSRGIGEQLVQWAMNGSARQGLQAGRAADAPDPRRCAAISTNGSALPVAISA